MIPPSQSRRSLTLLITAAIWLPAAEWHVSQSGMGAKDGTSPTNAWPVAVFNASTVPGGGDTVHFSGTITGQIDPRCDGDGSERLTLDFSAAIVSGTAEPRIRLTGRRYLDLVGGTAIGSHDLFGFTAGQSHDITIRGWTWNSSVETNVSAFCSAYYCYNLVIEDNHIEKANHLIKGDTISTHDVVIRGNYFTTSANTSDQTDIIFLGDAYNVTIEGNYLLMRTPGATDGRHNDCIQCYRKGGGGAGNPFGWIVRHNWIQLDVPSGSGDTSWMMIENQGNGSAGFAMKVYGNVFAGRDSASNNGICQSGSLDGAIFHFYNNTILADHGPWNTWRMLGPGILYSRNNVMHCPGNDGISVRWMMSPGGGGWDHNFFSETDADGDEAGPHGSTSAAPGFADVAAFDLALGAGSALRGAGDPTLDLEYRMGLVPGTTWPVPALAARSTWDAGAYVADALASDTQPPTAPADLTATVISADHIDLSWPASTDNVAVTGYRILRDGIMVGTTPATAASCTGLAPATTYRFAVVAFDAAGNASAASPSAVATTRESGERETSSSGSDAGSGSCGGGLLSIGLLLTALAMFRHRGNALLALLAVSTLCGTEPSTVLIDTAAAGRPVPATLFGADFVTNRTVFDAAWRGAFASANLHVLRYPGGTVAETEADMLADDSELRAVLQHVRDTPGIVPVLVLPTFRFAGDPAAAATYAQALVTRVNQELPAALGTPRVRYWELGNEYYQQLTAATYAELACAISAAVRATDAEAVPIVHYGRTRQADLPTIAAAIAAMPAGGRPLACCTHVYPGGTEGMKRVANQLRSGATALGMASTEWITEWNVAGSDPAYPSGMAQAGRLVAILGALIDGGATHTALWPLNWHPNSVDSALADADGTLRPAGQIIAALSTAAGDGTVLPVTVRGTDCVAQAYRSADGLTVVVAGTGLPAQQQLELAITGIPTAALRQATLRRWSAAGGDELGRAPALVENGAPVIGPDRRLRCRINTRSGSEVLLITIPFTASAAPTHHAVAVAWNAIVPGPALKTRIGFSRNATDTDLMDSMPFLQPLGPGAFAMPIEFDRALRGTDDLDLVVAADGRPTARMQALEQAAADAGARLLLQLVGAPPATLPADPPADAQHPAPADLPTAAAAVTAFTDASCHPGAVDWSVWFEPGHTLRGTDRLPDEEDDAYAVRVAANRQLAVQDLDAVYQAYAAAARSSGPPGSGTGLASFLTADIDADKPTTDGRTVLQASIDTWRARSGRQPIDLITAHAFNDRWAATIDGMRDLLDGDLAACPIVFDQIAPGMVQDYRNGIAPEPAPMDVAIACLDIVRGMLTQTDVARTCFAYWVGGVGAFLDRDDGGAMTEQPPYHAIDLYMRLPVTRLALDGVDADDSGLLHGIAARDHRQAAVLLWNAADEDALVDLRFPDLPASMTGRLLWRLATGDAQPEAVVWNGGTVTVPAHGIVLAARADPSVSELQQRRRALGSGVRCHPEAPTTLRSPAAGIAASYGAWDGARDVAYLGLAAGDGSATATADYDGLPARIYVNIIIHPGDDGLDPDGSIVLTARDADGRTAILPAGSASEVADGRSLVWDLAPLSGRITMTCTLSALGTGTQAECLLSASDSESAAIAAAVQRGSRSTTNGSSSAAAGSASGCGFGSLAGVVLVVLAASAHRRADLSRRAA